MGTYDPSHKSTYTLCRGLRGRRSAVRIGARSTLSLQVQ